MDENDMNLKETTLNNSESYLNESYFNAKNKSNKGSSMLNNNEEIEQEKKEYEILCQELKDSKVTILYEIEKSYFDYIEIYIGKNKYDDIYQIAKNEIGKYEVDNFRDFLLEIKEKIDSSYNKKFNFRLELEIKGDKKKNNCVLDCTYKLVTYDGNITQYKDFDILVNKTSEGFQYLLNYMNNFSTEN